ncbi:unnamed protein product [Prorocentrum cordatum]|nr:unnamed protein product [Polarella glacialis]
MTNLQASLGLAQLQHLPAAVARKREIGQLYSRLLQGCPGLVLPPDRNARGEANIYWVYAVEVAPEVPADAEEVMKRLAAAKVGTRPFFWPMRVQPVFRDMDLARGAAFPVAERIARRGFYILRRPGSQRRGLRGGCAARPVRQRPECAWAEEPGAVRGAAAAAGGRRRPRHRQRARAAPRGLCRQGHQGTGGDGGADGARVDGRDLQSDLLGGLELIDGLPESRQVVMNDGSGARGQRDVVAASRLLIWMRGAVAEGAMNGLAPETEWVVLLGDDVFVNLARLFYFVVQHPAREHPVVFAHCLSDTEAYDFDAPCLDGGAVLLNRLALDAIGEVASCRECPHVVSDQVSLGYCAFFNAVPLVHLPALHCHTPRMGDSDRHLVRDMLAHHWIAAGGLSASALAAEAPAAPWSPFEPGFPSFGCAAPPGRLWTLQQLSERLAFCGAAAGEGGGRQGPGSGRACPPRGGRQIKRGHKLFTKYTTRFKQWSPYYCSTMFGYSSCRGARPT